MRTKDFEAKTIQTYDKYAQPWSQSHAVQYDWEWAAERFAHFLPTGRVIEVGCGGGRDATQLLKMGYEYLGTDASAGMVCAARGVVPGALFRQISVYDLGKLATTFDGFWACAVLLHIPKTRIDEALQAISSVLQPGAIGMISIKDGNKEEFEVRDKQGAHEERLFAYWRRDDFTQVLERNGFQVVDYTYRPINERTRWHVFIVKKVS